MTDVFISYASEDRDRAGQLASALGALGWSVWWDRRIVTGQVFDQVIERELETAKSIVVPWSSHSIASEWVKNEAAVAVERGVLVPVIIERVKIPLEFRRRQTADLFDWKGELSHGGFQALCKGVTTTIGRAPRHQPEPPQGRRWGFGSSWVLCVIAAIVAAVGLTIYVMGPWRTSAPTRTAQNNRSVTGASDSQTPLGTVIELADLVVGAYYGDVVSDAKGGSRSDVAVTVTKLDRSSVRVSSDYLRLGSVDVTLTRSGNMIIAADGDTPFIVDLDRNPPTLEFTPRNEVAYRGNKQK
jgi:hypothetical protein